MFSSLIPGFREARSIFVPGYLWLGSGYLASSEFLISSRDLILGISNSQLDPNIDGLSARGEAVLVAVTTASAAWILGVRSQLISGVVDAATRRAGENEVVSLVLRSGLR